MQDVRYKDKTYIVRYATALMYDAQNTLTETIHTPSINPPSLMVHCDGCPTSVVAHWNCDG